MATLTTNTSTDAVGFRGKPGVTMYAKGTWGSGTLTLAISPDGSNWFSTTSTLTADGFKTITDRVKAVRATLAGATNPSLTIWFV